MPSNLGVGVCTFESGNVSGTYAYDRVIVPAGVTLTATGALTLDGTTLVEINGRIIGEQLTGASLSGSSIGIYSTTNVIVRGYVQAQNGTDAPTIDADVNATASIGGNGGNVYLSAGAGILRVEAAGRVASGSGGAGGTIMVLARADNSVATPTIKAVAGAGGQGGTLSISALTSTITGKLSPGNGGDGGNGYAVSEAERVSAPDYDPNATDAGYAVPGDGAEAYGGDGGNAGNLYLPAGYDIQTMAQLGLITEARGGDGGFAGAHPTTLAVPPLYGANGYPEYTPSPGTACSGGNGDWYGAKGQGGCNGGDSSAWAGHGGDGILQGGNGGQATAYAGHGGRGGNGHYGWSLTCAVHTNSGWTSCNKFSGGQGGQAGRGGHAYPHGGHGGDSYVEPGVGGNANAHAGNGGNGGHGGTGGGNFVIGFGHDDASAAMALMGCFEFLVGGPATWLACVAVVGSFQYGNLVCGAGGWKGVRGGAGDPNPDPGESGTLAGSGVGGTTAGSSRTYGSNGAHGSIGAKAQFWFRLDPHGPLEDLCAFYEPDYP